MPLHDLAYELQATFSAWVASFDLPLAALAWVTVAGGALGLHLLLRGVRGSRSERRWALAVGLVALGCHLQDIGVTLAVTPDLAIEANPLWRAVLARAGLPVAIAYGLTGKLLLALLSWQLFTLYLAQRHGLYPPRDLAPDFRSFWRAYGAGRGTRRLVAWVNLFAFAFPLAAPLMLYVSVLNAAEAPWLLRALPPWPVACVAWVGLAAGVWAWWTWSSWVRWRSESRPGVQ
ncbi:MAG: hypothetical protein ABIO70_30760 [Pseudomonadota bacterium]